MPSEQKETSPEIDIAALSKINHAAFLGTKLDGAENVLPAVTLADGTKVQTGTVGALIQNIKRYDELLRQSPGEEHGVTKEELEQMLTVPIPLLKKIGFLDVFPLEDWESERSPGRDFVGKKAKEMGL